MTPKTKLKFDGITQSIEDWALDYGIVPDVIIGRLRHGQSVARAITTPMLNIEPGQKLPAHPDQQSKERTQ